MAKTRLSIGMATYRDFDGVFFTLNALRLYHASCMDRCELVVVDNDPDGPQGERLRAYLDYISAGAGVGEHAGARLRQELPQPYNVQYVPFRNAQGTAAPRDHVFQVATGDAVLIIDSHVDIWPNAIAKLLDYFDSHPNCKDLLQGPLMLDSLSSSSTHFEDIWREGMWGTWGTAWRRSDGQFVCPRQTAEKKVALYSLLENELVEDLPLPWCGYEDHLVSRGYELATDWGAPFEIPAQGLGLFACRRDAWLGFNPEFREFGGEEWYIHVKYRHAGRKCLCLPWLKWLHRFADPSAGRHYARSNGAKIKNYLIGHRELGLPYARIYRHFVEGLSDDPTQPHKNGGTIDEQTWNDLLRQIEDGTVQKPASSAGVTFTVPIEQLFRMSVSMESEKNEHCAKLRHLASECQTVVEFGHRQRPTTVALLAGQPTHFVAYGNKPLKNASSSETKIGATRYEFRQGDSRSAAIPKCDLLFLDTKDIDEHLWEDFERHRSQVNRYIVVHDTRVFRTKGVDGFRTGISRLIDEHPEWAIIYHQKGKHALTVLSCQKSDHPPHPISVWPQGRGPGTELKAILSSLGITSGPSCECNKHAATMDEWGIEKCRDRRHEIVTWLRDGQGKWGWKDKLLAATKAVTTGLAFKLNPMDVFPSLVDEAIQRAASKEERVEDMQALALK